MRSWGLATLEHGVIVGVSGHLLMKRQAERRARSLRNMLPPDDRSVTIVAVKRTSSHTIDWGTPPTKAVASAIEHRDT